MRPEYALVYVPAGPFRMEVFLPKDRMARMAGALLAAGHGARVLDYATPSWLERFSFFTMEEAADVSWYDFWRQRRRADGLSRWLTDIAADIALHRPVTVCYFAETRAELGQVQMVADRLRSLLPEVRQETVSFGEAALGARPQGAAPRPATAAGEGSPACYEPSVYPALFGGGKLHLFPISLEAEAAESPDAPETVLAEIRAVQRAVPLGAFHLDGYLSATTVNEVAAGLLSGGHRCQYSTGCVPGPLSDSVWALARASGCRAVEWLVPSGSQRLLDDHFGARISVSHARRAVRMCRMAGIFSAVRFLYPCAGDDAHTAAETVYFAEKAEPDSVVVAPAAPEGPLRSARHTRIRDSLREDLARKGFPVQVEGWQGLLARAAQHDGRERRILGRYGALIENGDWGALSDEIAAFNRMLSHPSPRSSAGWVEAMQCAAAAN